MNRKMVKARRVSGKLILHILCAYLTTLLAKLIFHYNMDYMLALVAWMCIDAVLQWEDCHYEYERVCQIAEELEQGGVTSTQTYTSQARPKYERQRITQ